MKERIRILIPIVVLSGLAAAGYFVDRGRAAGRSQLSGSFESRPTYVSSRAPGRVVRLLVEEGSRVEAGQTIALLDAPAAEAEARSSHELAEQRRQQLEEAVNGPRSEEIRRQTAVVGQLKAELARLRNGARPEEIAQAESAYRIAEAEYRKALNGPRLEEVESVRAAEGRAKAVLDVARRGPLPEERAQLQANLDAAAAQAQDAKRNWDRARSLLEQGVISRQAAETAETAYRTKEAMRNQAREALDRAQNGTPEEELRIAREGYRQAQAHRKLVEAGTRAEDREAARQAASAARERWQLMVRGARREDLDAASRQVQAAQAVLDELHNGSRKEALGQAGAASRAAAAQARGAAAVADERNLRAPTAGVVERILVAEGDLLAAGAPVAVISDPSDVWIRVFLPESELAKVQVGDSASVRIDGILAPLAARVESISTQGEFTPANLQSPSERAKQAFGVRIRLAAPDPRVKAGMYATVVQLGAWK